MAMRQVKGSRYFVFFSYLLFLLGTPLVSTADEKGTAQTKQRVKPAAVAATKPSKAQAVTPPLVDLSEEAVQTSFDAFTIEWMKKLAGTEEFHRTQGMTVNQAPEGFSAEYTGYLPHRYIVVKKTESKETPYVGILTYFEKTMRCVGKTKEEARKGPFEASDSQQVSEIFRFTKGQWKY
ncbi:MAG: hypothetical protein HY268_19835 [Deltaproteobacteria bacterium]|nr:hypothetical protein [Deltaproteobacteria bacterium]